MDAKVQEELDRAGLALVRDERGLALADGDMSLRVDFADMLPRLAPGRLGRELVVRAARVRVDGRPPVLVDATAGLGEDALLLAASGFEVELYECNPVIALLLATAVESASGDPRLADAASRMHVHAGDGIAALRALELSPDVVYLDPMFPERRKSAAVKKKFQLLHRLEAPCEDEGELLGAALDAGPRKVVVKRPLKGPHLAGVAPSHVLRGKAVRYDCILAPQTP